MKLIDSSIYFQRSCHIEKRGGGAPGARHDFHGGRMHRKASEKRKAILDAAVKVFARKGYHGSRVSDIAREAAVAYGLVYHYFTNKEEILVSIFRERWSLFLDVIRMLDDQKKGTREKLHDIAAFLIDSFRFQPELVEVLTMEVTRNSRFFTESNLDLFKQAFELVEGIIREGQAQHLLRPEADPRMASYVFFGAIETVLTGYVLNTLDKSPEAFEQAKQRVVDIIVNGLAA